jgi:hypothetical protein
MTSPWAIFFGMILLHASMASMDAGVSSTGARCLETATTSAMVRSLPLTGSVTLPDDEGWHRCDRTKSVNVRAGVAMLIQKEARSQK